MTGVQTCALPICLLPTTAVDQLAATLASWMGVSDTNLALVAPNIGNYSERALDPKNILNPGKIFAL